MDENQGGDRMVSAFCIALAVLRRRFEITGQEAYDEFFKLIPTEERFIVIMNELTRAKTFGFIAFLVAAWGLSWPIYKIALAYTPPLLFAGMRTLLGGLLLALLYFAKRDRIRWKDNWPFYVLSSIFNVMLFYGLQTIGLIHLASGLFSVIVYLQPVLVGIFAWMWLGEAMTALKVTGLLLGFLGVAAVSAGGFTGNISVIGIVLALVTALSWAIGTVYVKKIGTIVDSIWLCALQCVIGGVVLTAAGSATESWNQIVWNGPYLFGLIFGITIGISASWIVYFKLINSGDASKVASYTFLVPLLSVFCGTLFLNEPFTVNLVIGLCLIAVSIYLVNRKARAGTQPLPPDRNMPSFREQV